MYNYRTMGFILFVFVIISVGAVAFLDLPQSDADPVTGSFTYGEENFTFEINSDKNNKNYTIKDSSNNEEKYAFSNKGVLVKTGFTPLSGGKFSNTLIIYNESNEFYKINKSIDLGNIDCLVFIGKFNLTPSNMKLVATCLNKIDLSQAELTNANNNYYLGSSLLNNCSNLEEIVLSPSINHLESFLLSKSLGGNFSSLKKITVLSDILYVGNSVFENLQNFETVEFKQQSCSVEYNDSFLNCSKVKNVCPQQGTVKIITQLSNPLSELSFPDGVQGTIELKLPADYEGSFHVPESVSELFFAKDIHITEITVDKENKYYGIYDGALYKTVPGGLQLVYVPIGCKTLEIPGSTVCISESYTSPNQNDNNVIGATRIFSQLIGLKQIVVKSGASFQIYDNMFMYNTALETIEFEDNCNISEIGSHVFDGSATGQGTNIILKEIINVPKTVQSIGEKAFYECTCLERITFEENSELSSIGNDAFNGCVTLQSITLPGSTVLGNNVFSRCTMLENVSITGTGTLAFHKGLIISGTTIYYALPKWEVVEIPSNVTTIGANAFKESVAKEILVEEENTTFAVLGSVVTSKDGTRLILVPNGAPIVNIPSDVKTIASGTFENSIAGAVYWKSTGDLQVEQYSLSNSYGKSNIKQLTIITDGKLDIDIQNDLPLTKLKIECSSLCSKSIKITKSFTADLIINSYQGTGLLNENVSKLMIENKDLSSSMIKGLFSTDKTYGNITIMQYSGSGWNHLDEIEVLSGYSLDVETNIDGLDFILETVALKSTGDADVCFAFVTPEGLTSSDITATVGSEELVAVDNTYLLTMSSNKSVLFSEKGAATEKVQVTFVYGHDITNKTIQVGKDRTLRSSDIASASAQTLEGYTFVGWYTSEKLDSVYVQGTVANDMNLYAKWSSNSGFTLTIQDLYGLTVKDSSGALLVSGDKVDGGSSITISYTIPLGFEFLGWKINGETIADESTSSTKSITRAIDGDTDIGVSYRYYSTSNSLINEVAASMPIEDIALRWSYSGTIDTTMNVWTGLPSIPLIVDDSVYTRINDDLLRIEISSGNVIASVHTDNSTVAAYYHYLGYGNGYIFDYSTHNIYNTDLTKSCPMDKPYTAIFYDSGSFYGLLGNIVYRFSITSDNETFSVTSYSEGMWGAGVSTNWFSQYGTTSSPVFANGKIYFIEAMGDSRYISYINVETGEKQQFTVAGWDKWLMDDGWLSYYEKGEERYLFTTMYNIGLFSTSSGETRVVCVTLNKDGSFGSDWRYLNLSETSNPNVETGTAGSAFVVFNGRGYVNAHGSLFVIDVDKLLSNEISNNKVQNPTEVLIYREESVSSHGSIVLNVSQFEKTGNVYVYLLPYNPVDQAVYIFTDNVQKNVASGYFKTSPAGASYGSQAVRAGPNNELLWYTDTGKLYCYAPISENAYTFLIDYGDEGAVYRAVGLNQSDALMDALDGNDVTYNIDPTDGITSINTISNSTVTSEYWSLYKYDGNGWVLADVYSSEDSDCHVFLIHYGAADSQGNNLDVDKQWIYLDDSNSIRTYRVGADIPDDMVGKSMALMGISDDSTVVSGNSVSSTITITNKVLNVDPKVKIYVKFSDNTFMQFTTKVKMIDGVSTIGVSMCGNATPEKMLVSVTDPDGNQLVEYRVNLSVV